MIYFYIILSWLLLAKIVFDKQTDCNKKFRGTGISIADEDNLNFNAWLVAIFAPISIVVYAIKMVFFKSWK